MVYDRKENRQGRKRSEQNKNGHEKEKEKKRKEPASRTFHPPLVSAIVYEYYALPEQQGLYSMEYGNRVHSNSYGEVYQHTDY